MNKMKRLTLLLITIALVFTLSACYPEQQAPYVVEVEKEVVVIQTETEVITVETNVIIPTETEFGFIINSNIFISEIYGNEIYTVYIEFNDLLVGESYYQVTRIDYYKSGEFVDSYNLPDTNTYKQIKGDESHQDYINELLSEETFESIQLLYEQLERDALINGE